MKFLFFQISEYVFKLPDVFWIFWFFIFLKKKSEKQTGNKPHRVVERIILVINGPTQVSALPVCMCVAGRHFN